MTRKILLALLFVAPLGFYPFLVNTGPSWPVDEPDDAGCCTTTPEHNWSPDERRIGQSLACLLASPSQSYPANLAWAALAEVHNEKAAALAEKLNHDPVGFLEDCLQQYEQKVEGYKLIFVKHEKVAGVMRKQEKIRVHFRESPFSVHMHWLKGQSECIRSMYVEGENDGKLVARGLKFGFEVPFVVTRALDAPDVKATSRFPITEFGIYKGAKSTIDAMRAAEKRGKLFVKYHGIECVKELGDRHCYKLVRSPYDPPEVDGINELTVFIDAETLMQTGSILKDAKGGLIAEYFFRDIELNPTFDPKQFTEKAL